MTNTTAEFIPFSSATAFNVGDLVQVDLTLVPARSPYRGVTFRVTAVPGGARKNLAVEPIGGGRGLKGHPSLFIGQGHPQWVGPREVVAPEAPTGPRVTVGSVIQLHSRAGTFVVIGETGGKFRAALLGGDGGHYVRGITPAAISKVVVDFEFTAR